jgi:serine/threonine protein kinase
MGWPLPHDFNEAVQNPASVFTDADLKASQVICGPTGMPLPRSGNFADVYQVRGSDAREWAVKCFTRSVTGLDSRYDKVSQALAKANLPFTIPFSYLTEGIRVAGRWMPIVKMEWVDGLQLNQFLRDNHARPAVLEGLLALWTRVAKRLHDSGLAHADLQHGNIMLIPGTKPGQISVRLID